MNDDQLDALVAAADAGVARDGLRVSASADGYRFETPEGRREGLDENELRGVAAENPWLVSNWHYWRDGQRPAVETAFLRWLESADERPVHDRYRALADENGITERWGELAIDVRLGEDGARRYAVRHEADADASLEDLAVHTDPLDARELVRYDDRGRYRPLKTAPTLSTGWAFTGLEGRSLVRAVDVVYPATVTNWYLERTGDLDVSHWRETMARQTGMYGVIETWDRGEGHEHVEWVAEACCADSQCLKRREWQYDADTELDVDGGDGAFPCREPCSLVVAAAREWTRLEGESPRSYTFELTPSEKRQLERILDAVADGTVDDVREGDFADDANRWRARYLRAKRVDDDGRLCGVPTDDE